jgi:hypothetical protein
MAMPALTPKERYWMHISVVITAEPATQNARSAPDKKPNVAPGAFVWVVTPPLAWKAPRSICEVTGSVHAMRKPAAPCCAVILGALPAPIATSLAARGAGGMVCSRIWVPETYATAAVPSGSVAAAGDAHDGMDVLAPLVAFASTKNVSHVPPTRAAATNASACVPATDRMSPGAGGADYRTRDRG